jgi:phosphoglycolate phosphatase
MKVGLLFDLDGTLLDTLGDLRNSVNVALAQFGYPQRTLAEIRSFVGTGARNLSRLSMPEGKDNVDEVLAAFQAHYKDHCNIETGPYAGIPAALEELKDIPVAIVSNKPDYAVKELAAIYFPGIYALGETPDCPRKPAPDMVYKAMAQLGVDRCVYVGDSEVDIITANNAGVPCLSVLWGFRDRECLEEAGGKYYCENPKDLTKTLMNMLEKL